MKIKKAPKYSIIIPVRNGIEYLPSCINTILAQKYNDYELIISNDHSTDGTKEYLDTLVATENIEVIEPIESLSMTEHWEYALSHASGDWMIFVGQDDGLQHYFFELADILTSIADENDIRTVMSSRAYYFWQGCEYMYGSIAVKYRAIKKVQILNTKFEAFKALIGFQEYFELPQMYTTSLFKKSLIEEAKSMQEGKVFSSHPQDANLAAIACSLEKKYLKSFIPLGWVGSSPKSAGMAIMSETNKVKKENRETIKLLKKDYEQKILDSALKYHELAGNFSLGSLQIYFWQALLKTNILRARKINDFLVSKIARLVILGSAFYKINDLKKPENLKMMKEVLKKNDFGLFVIYSVSYILRFLTYLFYSQKIIRKLVRKIVYKQFSVKIHQNDNNASLLADVSNKIYENIDRLELLKKIKL